MMGIMLLSRLLRRLPLAVPLVLVLRRPIIMRIRSLARSAIRFVSNVLRVLSGVVSALPFLVTTKFQALGVLSAVLSV